MTINRSWGYQKADDDWKTSKTIVLNLITCAKGGGNYLLNIGPKPDGSVPDEEVRTLEAVGRWMSKNGPTICESEPFQGGGTPFANFTRKGNTLYIHVYFWPGDRPAANWLTFFQPQTAVAIGGLRAKVKSARLFASCKKVDFRQDDTSVQFTSLPTEPPDDPVSVIAAYRLRRGKSSLSGISQSHSTRAYFRSNLRTGVRAADQAGARIPAVVVTRVREGESGMGVGVRDAQPFEDVSGLLRIIGGGKVSGVEEKHGNQRPTYPRAVNRPCLTAASGQCQRFYLPPDALWLNSTVRP